MKKYHKISLITTVALFVTVFLGCKKLLEVNPQSAITEQVYFKSEGDFEPYLNGIYTFVRALSNNVTYGTERSEELISASNSRFGTAWTQIITPTSGAVNYIQWYQGIGNCNLLIDKVNGFNFSNDDLKKKILGEAYTLRAFFYFHLTRVIGDTPLMLQPVVDENVPLLSRAPAADVMRQIQADLAEAIKNFQSQSGFSKTAYPSKYRFCYGSAMCLRADAYLWSAKVLNGGTNDLNAAITAATEAESTGLTLNSNFASVIATRAVTNTEVAMAAYHQRDEAGNNYGINALAALQFIQGATNLDQIPYTAQVGNGQGAYQISAESRALFSNTNDKRIPATYIAELRPNGNVGIYWITKLLGTKYADDRISDNDLILYRLADMHLIKAEAYAALGDIPNALASLNKVRARAGTDNYAGSTIKAAVEKEILDEWGREFYFENKRWYNLVRFHKGGTIDLYTYVPNLRGKGTPLYWPLNTTVLANNPNIKQTEGY